MSMSRILDNLYIGDLQDSQDARQLKKNEITAIVRVYNNPEQLERANVDPPPAYHFVSLDDYSGEPLRPHIQGVNDFIHRARLTGVKVLVHCAAGVSRSVALTIAYLMSATKFGYEDVFRVVSHGRREADPNIGFRHQLMKFDQHGLEAERKRLRDGFQLQEGADPLNDNKNLEQILNTVWRPMTMVTLNAWGVALPYIENKDRWKRMDAIGYYISQQRYDIVVLQEVWEHKDFELIKQSVAKYLPAAFYYQAGLIGSGICIFTSGVIYATMMYRYSSNLFPEDIGRGDICAGRVIGLARVLLRGIKVDVYATHFQPAYCEGDRYRARRIQQVLELSQFINGSSKGDISVVLGNLNVEDREASYKLLLATSQLHDAFTSRIEKPDPAKDKNEHGWTWHTPWNYYTPTLEKQRKSGKRVDYVLYRSNGKAGVKCETCRTGMGELYWTFSSEGLYHSDHEAVIAELEVQKEGATPKPHYEDVLDKATEQVRAGIENAWKWDCWYWLRLCLALVVFVVVIKTGMGMRVSEYTGLVFMIGVIVQLVFGVCGGALLLICFYFAWSLLALKLEKKENEWALAVLTLLTKTKKLHAHELVESGG